MVLWIKFWPKKNWTVGGHGETLTVSIILIFQGFVVLVACYSVIMNFNSITMIEVFAIYFSKVIFFGMVYTLCYIIEPKAFHHLYWLTDLSYLDVCMAFMYYSMSKMTLIGLGDISPATALVEALSMIQYCLGISYTIFIVSQAVDVIAQRSRTKRGTSNWWKQWIVRDPLIRRIRWFLRKMLFLIVAVAQSVKIFYFGTTRTTNVLLNDRCTSMEFFIFLTMDIALLLIIIVTSSKIINWNSKHRDIRPSFIIQLYLSCTVISAGIYIDIQAVSSSHISPFWPTTHWAEVQQRDYSTIVFHFFDFALKTQTAVGASGNLQPRSAIAYLLIMIQMGQSFIFHTYIVGLWMLKIRMTRMSSPRKVGQFLFEPRRGNTRGSPKLYGSREPLLSKYWRNNPQDDDPGPLIVVLEEKGGKTVKSKNIPKVTSTIPIETKEVTSSQKKILSNENKRESKATVSTERSFKRIAPGSFYHEFF